MYTMKFNIVYDDTMHSPLTFCDSLCEVHTCTCVCFACLQPYMSVCIWSPQVDIGCLPLLLSTLNIKSGFLP